jgi:phytoene desaturase
MKKVAVIGSGFSGLAAATTLADKNCKVTVFEKNSSPGGRARKFEENGFLFDMGPSWYWMPDVFERYFNRFGKSTRDYYQLERLNPSYRIYFGEKDSWDVPAGETALQAFFEQIEPGSGARLKKFLEEGKYKYEVGINDLVYKPGLSLSELLDWNLITGALRLHVFQSISAYVRKYFRNPKLIQLLEFPVLFLGAAPAKTPALYSLMNYADMALGTWYPKGGMHEIVKAMVQLAEEKGVEFRYNSPVEHLPVTNGRIEKIQMGGQELAFDAVVAAADYHHVEQHLLPQPFRRYTEAYWQSRVMAPSSLIFYLGVDKPVKGLLHHNLFFDQDFTRHAHEIYEAPAWPEKPLFYVCCTSKSDPTVAPAGQENIFILIPVAPGLKDEESVRELYYQRVMDRLEKLTGDSIRNHVVYKRSYAHNDFISDYHAFKGNAYGLANTILQTANLKPGILNKKVKNLFYTGQLTVPGPGVPPSLISGQVVGEHVWKQLSVEPVR